MLEGQQQIEVLEAEIRDLRVRIGHCAHHLADLGDRLLRAKELVPVGEWLVWLEERVEVSRQTARHYMNLAILRRDDPARFEEVTALGLKAAYVVNGTPRPACPGPERVAGRIERLLTALACVEAAPREAKARAVAAAEALLAAVRAWREEDSPVVAADVPPPDAGGESTAMKGGE